MSILSTTQLLNRIGPQTGADGTLTPQRAGKETDLIISQLRGKYAEACARGQLFTVCTAVAGQAQLLTNTAVTMLDIANPLTSGVRLELCGISVGYVSGTLAPGDILHGKLDTQGSVVPTTGTPITPQSLSIGKVQSAIWTAGNGRSVAATPTVLWPFLSVGSALATTALGFEPFFQDVDGLISIEPGGAYCMIGVAVGGTSPVLHLAAIVRQIPLI